MDTLRRRNPFKSTDDPLDEDRVLDEQEQDELIEKLHEENKRQNLKHYRFIQACLSYTIIFQVIFMLLPRQITPFYVFLPNHKTPRSPLMPLTTFWALFDTLVLLNLVYRLPQDLSFPRLLRYWILRSTNSLKIPYHTQQTLRRHLPLSETQSGLLLCIPPIIAIVCTVDIPQILWWILPLFVFASQMLVISWIKETEREMEGLEKLKYEAKGA